MPKHPDYRPVDSYAPGELSNGFVGRIEDSLASVKVTLTSGSTKPLTYLECQEWLSRGSKPY